MGIKCGCLGFFFLGFSTFSLDSEGRVTVPTGAGLGVELQDKIGKQALRVEPAGE
jgi:hypothetical protein